MFWLTILVITVAASLHAIRTAQLWSQQGWPEHCARWSTTTFVGVVAVAFAGRASIGGPFLWFHWLTLAAGLGMVGFYLWLMAGNHRAAKRRRAAIDQAAVEIDAWLSEVQHLEPCDNPDCRRIRREMGEVADTLRKVR